MKLISRKDSSLFEMLSGQAHVATQAAKAFFTLVDDLGNVTQHNDVIRDLEHEGDRLTHELQDRIAATFITPLDKEDLKELSQALDDVTDFVEAAAARVELYRVSEPRAEIKPMAELLVRITQLTEQAVGELGTGFRKSRTLQDILKEIHTVENESDRVFRTALSKLFHEPDVDPLTVIKWKELFDRVETAVDKCEDIAALIGTILIKYA